MYSGGDACKVEGLAGTNKHTNNTYMPSKKSKSQNFQDALASFKRQNQSDSQSNQIKASESWEDFFSRKKREEKYKYSHCTEELFSLYIQENCGWIPTEIVLGGLGGWTRPVGFEFPMDKKDRFEDRVEDDPDDLPYQIRSFLRPAGRKVEISGNTINVEVLPQVAYESVIATWGDELNHRALMKCVEMGSYTMGSSRDI